MSNCQIRTPKSSTTSDPIAVLFGPRVPTSGHSSTPSRPAGHCSSYSTAYVRKQIAMVRCCHTVLSGSSICVCELCTSSHVVPDLCHPVTMITALKPCHFPRSKPNSTTSMCSSRCDWFITLHLFIHFHITNFQVSRLYNNLCK
jgi:hypothetical protein